MSDRRYHGVLWMLAVGAAAAAGCGQIVDESAGGQVGQQSSAINEVADPAPAAEAELPRAPCDLVACGDPVGCGADCEAQYGASSGLPYSLWAMGQKPPCTTSTNSDCYSQCFRDCCKATAPGGPQNLCECHTTGLVAHRYWCCEGQSVPMCGCTTWQGWSETNYCEGKGPIIL